MAQHEVKRDAYDQYGDADENRDRLCGSITPHNQKGPPRISKGTSRDGKGPVPPCLIRTKREHKAKAIPQIP